VPDTILGAGTISARYDPRRRDKHRTVIHRTAVPPLAVVSPYCHAPYCHAAPYCHTPYCRATACGGVTVLSCTVLPCAMIRMPHDEDEGMIEDDDEAIAQNRRDKTRMTTEQCLRKLWAAACPSKAAASPLAPNRNSAPHVRLPRATDPTHPRALARMVA